MGEITFNNRSSKEIGLEVEIFPSYQAPRRSYEKVHIPGRNGDLLIDDGSWENTVRTYSVSIGSYERSYYEMMIKVSEWLHSTNTYARLEDSYEPDYYRMAAYLEEIEFNNIYDHGGRATISFECKPQRFLKVGEEPILITNPAVLLNPTNYPSLPVCHIYGKGTGVLNVGGNAITISDIGDEMIIDSDLQDAYFGTTNKNSKISIPNGFPELGVGSTTIGYSGGITKVEVTPRWYTL